MFNFNGNAAAINAATQLSLHSTNPGTGLTPAGGTELTDTPYARQTCVFDSPVANGTAAESALNTDVTFNLHLSNPQNVQFVGLWAGSTYLGYFIPSNPFNFTGTVTTRQFIVEAADTKLIRDNP